MPPVAYPVEQIRGIGVKRELNVLIRVLLRIRGKPWIAVVVPIKTLSLKGFEVFQQRFLSVSDPSIVTTWRGLSQIDNSATRQPFANGITAEEILCRII